MEIKIEKGAKVQITDKPIVNNIVYGDVVQRKEVSLPKQTRTSKNDSAYSVQEVLDRVESNRPVCWSEVTNDYRDINFMKKIILSCSSFDIAQKLITDILKQTESDIDYLLRQEMGENYTPNWKSNSEKADVLWALSDDLRTVLNSRSDRDKMGFSIKTTTTSKESKTKKTQDVINTEASKVEHIDENFIDRVKAIICKAATKNNEVIRTNQRGHKSQYKYYVDSDTFCKAIDEMDRDYQALFKDLLGGSMNCVQVTKVCLFIGHIIRMHIINDTNLQLKDISFAFEEYYNLVTVNAKLGDKKENENQNLFWGIFEGILKKHKG